MVAKLDAFSAHFRIVGIIGEVRELRTKAGNEVWAKTIAIETFGNTLSVLVVDQVLQNSLKVDRTLPVEVTGAIKQRGFNVQLEAEKINSL